MGFTRPIIPEQALVGRFADTAAMTTQPSSSPSPNHFDAAARNWDQRPMSQQMAAIAPRLLAAVPLAATDHVLDFGAGTGLLAAQIAPLVAQVTALDTSAAMLQVLTEKGHANITALQGDIFALPPGTALGPFDAIVSAMALHHVADTAALLRTFTALLRPGGRVALVDLYAEDGSFHGDNAAKGVHHLGFAPEALQALAEQAGFCDVALTEILQVQHKNGHSYPLFLLTARKP